MVTKLFHVHIFLLLSANLQRRKKREKLAEEKKEASAPVLTLFKSSSSPDQTFMPLSAVKPCLFVCRCCFLLIAQLFNVSSQTRSKKKEKQGRKRELLSRGGGGSPCLPGATCALT